MTEGTKWLKEPRIVWSGMTEMNERSEWMKGMKRVVKRVPLLVTSSWRGYKELLERNHSSEWNERSEWNEEWV